jgi:hypothetical protein
MAWPTERAARTDISPLRSWIVRHPIATFLVLVFATTTALVFVPQGLRASRDFCLAERHRTGHWRMSLGGLCQHLSLPPW